MDNKQVVTTEEVQNEITPDFVKQLGAPTEKFLCKLTDNIYKIKFGAFRIRDMTSGIVLVDVSEEEVGLEESQMDQIEDDPKTRLVKYHFGPDFLLLKTIGLKVEFSVGDKAVPNMMMVERHYFRGKCIKSYDFNFTFCIPNSKNSWEVIYDLPELSPEEKQEMINAPWETKSDTFFFVDNRLVIHNRAEYNYEPFEES